jgi:DMSO reductase family type II enzyme chaperone
MTLSLTGLQSAEALAAAARSLVYQRLAEGFSFPTPSLAEAVTSRKLLDDLLAAASHLPFELSLDAETDGALSDPSLNLEDVRQEYLRLFEVGPGKPPCPLYEGSHRSGRMRIMEEVVRFFEHFGLRPQPGDQPDHLCAELEFMHYMAFKEAAALSARGETQGLALAQRDFLARHLCRWLPRLRARIEDCGAAPLYRAFARLAEGFCWLDLAALKECQAKPDEEIGPLPD